MSACFSPVLSFHPSVSFIVKLCSVFRRGLLYVSVGLLSVCFFYASVLPFCVSLSVSKCLLSIHLWFSLPYCCLSLSVFRVFSCCLCVLVLCVCVCLIISHVVPLFVSCLFVCV